MHGSGRCVPLLYIQTLISPPYSATRSLMPFSVSSGTSSSRQTRHSPQRPSSICQGTNMLPFQNLHQIFAPWDRVSHRSNAPQTIISMEVLYCIGTAAFKYSALLLFHRIFGSVPHLTAFLWCLAFVILANNIAEIFCLSSNARPCTKLGIRASKALAWQSSQRHAYPARST